MKWALAPLLGSGSAALMNVVSATMAITTALANLRARFAWEHVGTTSASTVNRLIGAAAVNPYVSTRFLYTGAISGLGSSGKPLIGVRSHNGVERGKQMGMGIRNDGLAVFSDGISMYGTAGSVALQPDTVYVLQKHTTYGTDGTAPQTYRIYSGDGLTLLEDRTAGRNPSGGGAGDALGALGCLVATVSPAPHFYFWDSIIDDTDWPDPTRSWWGLYPNANGDDLGGTGAYTDVDDLAAGDIDTGSSIALTGDVRRAVHLTNPLDASGLTIEEVLAMAYGQAADALADLRVYQSDGTNRPEGTDFLTAAATNLAGELRRTVAPNGAAWSHALLDALQIGVHNADAGFDSTLYTLAAFAWATGVPAGGGGGGPSLNILRLRHEGY